MGIDNRRRNFILMTGMGAAGLTGSASAQNADNLSSNNTSSDTGNVTGNETDGEGTDGEDREPQTFEVSMVTEGSEYYFDPIGLHVQPGDTVRWINESGTHSATAYEDRIPEGADAWDSGTLSEEGATFEYTFEQEGTYDYYCTPHKSLGMIGRIVCGEPGGPAEGSTPPDTPPSNGQFPTSDAITEQGSLAYPFTGTDGGGDGGNGGGEVSLEEVGVPYQAHFVGIGAIFVIFTSLVYSFYFLKYAESPEHKDQRDR